MNSPLIEMVILAKARFLTQLSVIAVMTGFAAISACAQPPHGTRTVNVEPVSPSVDQAALQGLLRGLSSRFRPYETDHFVIITDARVGELRDFREAAEATYRRGEDLALHLAIPVRSSQFKLPLLIYSEWEDYAAAARRAGLEADKGMPGFFDESRGLCTLFDYVNLPLIRELRQRLAAARERLESGGEADGGEQSRRGEDRDKRTSEVRQIEEGLAACESVINQTVVRHEIAHQVISSFGILGPGDGRLWLKEGLAMRFECDGSFGDNRYRLADFFAETSHSDLAYIRTLVGDPRLLSPGADGLPQAYAAAGVLVYHLIEHRPAAFARYMRETPTTSAPADRPARIAAFEAALGPLDEKFELEFHATIDALKQTGLRSGSDDGPGKGPGREGKRP